MNIFRMLEKTQTQLKRLTYRVRKDYLTLNNLVFAAAILISLSWTWSSIEVMQQNYELQQAVDTKKQQLAIEELRVANLELESTYYNSLEYQELAVRERLGKGLPGESVLIVPSTDRAESAAVDSGSIQSQPSNFQEWMNFILGGPRKGL